MTLPLFGLFIAVVLWALKQPRWAIVMVLIVCYFD